MRLALSILAVVAQLVLLGVMAGQREYIHSHGKVMYLQTEPVPCPETDTHPDLMLGYDFGRVARDRCRDGLLPLFDPGAKDLRLRSRGKPVYAVLHPGPGNIMEMDYLTDRKPASGDWIRGRLGWFLDERLRVRYGLESYYLQNPLLATPAKSALLKGFQCPLEMEAAVSPEGIAVIRGHRPGPLAVKIRPQYEPAGGGGKLVAAEVTIRNQSERPLGLVDLPADRSFQLETTGGTYTWRDVSEIKSYPALDDSQVVTLAPGQTHQWRIDFQSGRWQLTAPDGTPQAIPALGDPVGVRLVYTPPDAETCKSLTAAAIIWHGRLPLPVVTSREPENSGSANR